MKNNFSLLRLCLAGALLFAIHQGGLADTNDALSAQILDVAAREGDAYMQGRKTLENLYRNKPQEFDELLRITSDWRVEVMVGIVKERVTKANEITRFEATQMKFSDTRSWVRKIVDVGDDMVTHGKPTPMVLVEKIWKGNELHNYPSIEAWGCASVLYALGKMRVEKARPIVENVVTNDMFFSNRMEIVSSANTPEQAVNVVRQFAANTLGEFGDSKSVPALMVLLKNTTKSDFDDAGPATHALVKCMTAESIPDMEKTLEQDQTERYKRVLKNIIQEFNKKKH